MKDYNQEIQLKDILVKFSEYKIYLYQKKFSIIICACLFLLIGIGINFMLEPKYNAELTFVIEGDQGGSPLNGLASISSQFGVDFGGKQNGTFSANNIIELLKSRGVIVSALMHSGTVNKKSDLLIEHYLEINRIKDDWGEDEQFKGFSFHKKNTYVHDSISGRVWSTIIKDNLTVDFQTDDANIITLSYFSLNEEFAKEFAEKLIDQMSKMYDAHQTAQANNTLDFLQNRADSVFSELEIAEQQYAKVTDINSRIVKASGRLKEMQLLRRVEVLNTMYLEIVKNLELSKITLLNKTPIINIIDKPVLPLPEDKTTPIILALIGMLLGGFLSSFYFVFKKLFRDALAEA